MSDRLPVKSVSAEVGPMVPDPDTGQLVTLRAASDRAIMVAAERVKQADDEVLAAKRTIAAEMRRRHGVGVSHAGGYAFQVAESVTWPKGAVEDVLRKLQTQGIIAEPDVRRAMPEKPTPDGRAIKALIGRLTTSHPEAAKMLADVATTSPPSLRDVQREATEEVRP